ncbi:MAG TPA: hypothetical protein P5279_18090 [Anaerohalosphaeraceae bacterium]|nr:hypothetical protein [Anaerohalosphaeraceae bacterium]
MATKYGTNATILASLTPSNLLKAEQSGGVVRSMTEEYTGARVVSGDIIYLGKMPKGAIPLFGVIRYNGSDTGILKIGYTGDIDALGTTTALATTKTQVLYPAREQINKPLTNDTDIYATMGINSAHALATTDTVDIHYLYAKE